MSDEAIKKDRRRDDRIANAKESAKAECLNLGYRIINSDNCIYCFIASIAGIYERKIRVIVDEATKEDLSLILNDLILPNQTKEIWCRLYKSRQFKTLRFDHQNNSVNK